MSGQRKKGQNKRVKENELQDRLLRGRVQYLRCGALFFCLFFYQSQGLLGLEPKLRCNRALAAIPGGHPFRDDSPGYIYIYIYTRDSVYTIQFLNHVNQNGFRVKRVKSGKIEVEHGHTYPTFNTPPQPTCSQMASEQKIHSRALTSKT